MARMISPQELLNGGLVNGVQVDTVIYLLGALRALEEEIRLACVLVLLAFSRRPGENNNGLLARYDTVRQRA
eukprot:11201366-Lingulodinium_polyedra.AAC.1